MTVNAPFTPSTDVQHCVATLLKCHEVCLETIDYIEQRGTVQGNRILPGIDYCGHVSRVAARFLSRGSKFCDHFFQDCAEIFDKFAPTKNQFNYDFQLNACVEICQQAALVSRRIASSY